MKRFLTISTAIAVATFSALPALAGDFGSGGVREIRKADYLSGVQFVRITCNSGGSRVIGQRSDGYWVDSGFSNMGDRFRNMSANEVAEKGCR
ncbi:hypothetical protein [Magnetospirillum sp. 15-1]|uniref:hypothetical protein n=1 Tax=Magnetospirillum sp. 15-1 TaxID=1979370 RepID=UPI000BBB9BA0|nr:hypothetical protein [Magnetospirillum sp. 15-1]